MGKIKVLAYDLDGTILNSLPMHYEAIKTVCGEEKLCPPPLCSMCDWWHANFEDRFREIGVTLPSEKIWSLYEKAAANFQPDIYYDFAETADLLKKEGYLLYIVSACTQRKWVMDNLEKHGLINFFDKVFSGKDDKVSYLRQVAEESGVKIDEVLFVGDMRSDVRDGLLAGCQVIGFDGGFGGALALKAVGAKDVISSHKEIFNHLG